MSSQSNSGFSETANVSENDVIASAIDDYLQHELIYRRNKRMAVRIKNLLARNTNKSLFFALGAGKLHA